MLKKFFIISWGLVGLFILIGLLLSKTIDLNEKLNIIAPTTLVFSQIENLNNWKKWATWSQNNKELSVLRPQGVGAMQIWKEGNMTAKLIIKEVNEPIFLSYDLLFDESVEAQGEFHLEANGQTTTINFRLFGTVAGNIFGGYIAMLSKNSLQEQLKGSLLALKDLVEKGR